MLPPFLVSALLAAKRRRALRKCMSCGHAAEVHQHYRPDTDCGMCGCLRFQR